MNHDKSIDNIYKLDGKVPVGKAIPFGLQHILAMFVANIAPILIVAGACGLSAAQTTNLVQCAMMIAGIGSLIQLFPLWKIGSGLPIVMGISFTFVSIFCVIGPEYGYGSVVGAILVGGLVEGTLGLFAKYWRKIVSPIVAASVVTSIGFSLLSVGATSFGGALFQSVVAFFKLIFQHIRVLPADRVKSVVLRRNFDSRLCLFLSCALIDERELHQNGSVKVVEKIAPVFKNGGLIICLCKLIVNIFKDKAFTVFLFRYPANPVRVHLQVGNGLLCGVGLPVALCRLYHGGDFFLFCAGQLTLHGIFYRAGHGFSFCH